MSQSNTRVGDLPFEAGVDLREKVGCVVKLGSVEGRSVVLLPADDVDPVLFVVVEGANVGDFASVRPLDPARNVRVRLLGVCDPGDVLVSGDTGEVRALPAVVGSYRGQLIAEELGGDGQLVLARPASVGLITVN